MSKEWILDAEWSTDGSNAIWIVVVRDVANEKAKYRFHEPLDFAAWMMAEEQSGGLTLIGHNIIDADKRILEQRWGIDFRDTKFIDTLLLSRLDDPVRKPGHSLEDWGNLLSMPKGNFKDYNNPCEEMYTYCEQDTLITWHVYRLLMSKGHDEKAIKIEHDLQQYCLTPTKEKGFLLDQDKTRSLLVKFEQDMIDITAKLAETFPEKVQYKQLKTKVKIIRTPFNPGSRQQIAERLEAVGWSTEETTPGGKPKVDEKTLMPFQHIPEVAAILEYLLTEKRVGQLRDWLRCVEPDGRVRCHIIGTGTITSRASHSKPNLGQVTGVHKKHGADMRACWTVPEGYSLVGVDLVGIEARMNGHYTQDFDYAKELLEGDIHSKNKELWKLKERMLAKTVYYAILYGCFPPKLVKLVGCDLKTATKMIDDFYDSLPKLKALKQKVDRLSKKGYLPGLDGRRVPVRSAHSALNTLFQSGGAIVAKLWYILSVEALTKAGLDATVVMWVHDELQIETKEGYEEQVANIVMDCAKSAGVILNCRLPIEASAKWGKTWYDTH